MTFKKNKILPPDETYLILLQRVYSLYLAYKVVQEQEFPITDSMLCEHIEGTSSCHKQPVYKVEDGKLKHKFFRL